MSRTISKLNNGNDAWVLSGTTAQQSTNYSTTGSLALRTGGAGTLYSYIYFSKPFPPGATIISATLKFWNTENQSGSRPVTVKRLTQAWYLSKINWKNQPAASAVDTKTLTKTSPVRGTEWDFDVTTHMQAASDGQLFYGWRIEMASTALMYFYSTQATGANAPFKPVLEVVWATPPGAPTQLSPAGSRAVSVAKPVVRFNFSDTTGSTSLAAVQIQVNVTNVWTAPTFDSGTVLTNVPQLDLTTTAYAGLADGSTTYWRVRVQDDVGQWSPWSAATSFKRLSKGTLTLDNPPSGGNITEPTPPVLWTFTGRTQKAYQVTIKSAAGTVLHDSGKVTSTADSYTVPAGVIKASGVNYTFTLNVWDDQDRESMAGDAAYVQVVRAAPYVFDNTVAGVTGLTATPLTPLPGVTVAWSRSTAPDSFVVWRDGKIIYQSVNPSDWNTGSTNYAVSDPYADPKKLHTYFVQAVVNGKASLTNPTATATPNCSGIWLSDVARGINVQILGVDEGTWDMKETSAVYSPVGGTRSVVVTQSLGGYEGSISGVITSHDAVDVDAEEAKLWELKSTPGTQYVLTLSNMAMLVVITNVVISPTTGKDLQKKVSFKFYEQAFTRFTPVL